MTFRGFIMFIEGATAFFTGIATAYLMDHAKPLAAFLLCLLIATIIFVIEFLIYGRD